MYLEFNYTIELYLYLQQHKIKMNERELFKKAIKKVFVYMVMI